jgi:hypothetical protein
MTAHVGTYEYWVQQALAQVAPGVPYELRKYEIDVKPVPLSELLAEQDRVLAEIDEAARAAPKAVLFYDPAEAAAWPLQVGDCVTVIQVHDGAECVWIPPSWREERRAILEERLDAQPLDLPLLEQGDPDDSLEDPKVWAGLRPNGLDREQTHCTRRDVRCPEDLDVRSKMMRAFCWPTAVHPYRWPS